MRIRIETQARTAEQIEAAKHFSQLSVQDGHMVVRIMRRPWVWLPKWSPFMRWTQLQEVLVLPLPERASSTEIQTLLESKSSLYRDMGLQLSLSSYAAALKRSQKLPWLGFQVNNLWAALLLLLVWLVMQPKPNTIQNTAQVAQTATELAQTDPSNPQALAAAETELAAQSSIPAVARSTQLTGLSSKQAIEQAEKTQGHIVLRNAQSGADTLVMFLDPLCKHCRAFESVLAQLPSNLGLKVIPVAYQRGSKPLVQQVLCAPAAKAEQWRTLMSERAGQLQPQADCLSNLQLAKLVDENSILFARAGMLTTPALVLQSSGKTYTGTDLSLPAIQAWLKS